MQALGHQQLELHKPSDFGMASPMIKLSMGLLTEVRLNHGAVVKLMPAIDTLPPLYGHRQSKKLLIP